MQLMFIVISIMFSGVAVGYLFRERRWAFLPKVILSLIILLLFVLGSEVGANAAIMDNLGTLGLEALVITLGALAGSILLSWAVYVQFFKRKHTPKQP